MLLFNSNAINSFLLFVLLFTMIIYFIVRSEKNREVTFLIIFIVQLVLWQFCFFIRNIYFDPVAAYPLHFFLHSGYTLFSYLALAMFSYYFIEPVFQRESRVVFIIGLIPGSHYTGLSSIEGHGHRDRDGFGYDFKDL